ncbi:MAG: hypothetical protein CMJ78_19590 [Planctomycetaceae bacterium]|nr:hypothetical protein [Planctomycetaceae bacterium]
MNSLLLLASVLTPQPVELIDPMAAKVPRVLTPTELRKAYITVAAKSSKTARPKPKPEGIVPELAAVYYEISRVDRISFREKKRMRITLKARMEKVRDDLLRERFRAKTSLKKPLNGTEQQNADALIDLIQNTIAPDSWDVAGGLGTIRYFGLLRALVVRTTGEGHHQVGGLINALEQ